MDTFTEELADITREKAQIVRPAETPAEGVLLQDALEVFAGAHISHSDRTKEIYERSILEFLAWLQGQGIETTMDIRPIDLKLFRAELQRLMIAGKYKASTVANKLVAVRRFLLRCAAEGFCPPAITQERIQTYLASPRNAQRGKLPVLPRGRRDKRTPGHHRRSERFRHLHPSPRERTARHRTRQPAGRRPATPGRRHRHHRGPTGQGAQAKIVQDTGRSLSADKRLRHRE